MTKSTKAINEKMYVYCHDCNKILFKGPREDAVHIGCDKHAVTYGSIGYINKSNPEVDTSTWSTIHPDKGCLIEVYGNVCEPQFCTDNEIAVIPHCCNNLGAMGAGVALSLKNKWGGVYDSYEKMENESKHGLKHRLGEVCWAGVADNIVVVNMIGQDGIVSYSNPKPVKYWALLNCMQATLSRVVSTLHMHLEYDKKTPVFHCPKFGSDLAGGNWELILELIKETWIDRGFDVVVYEFEADKEKWGKIDS